MASDVHVSALEIQISIFMFVSSDHRPLIVTIFYKSEEVETMDHDGLCSSGCGSGGQTLEGRTKPAPVSSRGAIGRRTLL